MSLRSVGIIGTGKYVPKRVLTNADIEKMVDTSDEWIVTRTGIKERRIAAEWELTSDLAFHAAERALQAAGIVAEELDLIVIATITPETSFPSTACLVQKRLGATRASAFDLSAACSGFIYGLANASNFIAIGAYKYTLVIGAECLSRITDYTDRNTCILFGDGAGAVVLGPVAESRGFKSFVLGADGNGSELLKMKGSGLYIPSLSEMVEDKRCYIYMNGREVFKFAVRIMGNAAEEALEKAGKSKEDISLMIPHQANIRIIQAVLERLNLPGERCVINLPYYANTSAASIPLALAEAMEEGRIQEGDTVLLVGFGGGLTWGASVIVW